VPLPILRKGSVGFNACPDMVDPLRMLRLAKLASDVGFEAVWTSDHFHPWFDAGATEYNTWVWMTAAMKEVGIPFGTAVTAPLFRYHPAITAQAFATMEALFGHRVILGVGTGEAMNEVPLGYSWPRYAERRDRLVEAVQLIKRLWSGGFVDYHGKYYSLKGANLYMKADVPIVMSAMGPKMAKIVGRHGDGLITSARTPDFIKGVLFPAASEGARESGRSLGDLLKVVEIDIGYDEDYDRAIGAVRKWGATMLDEVYNTDISDPREIEAKSKTVSDRQLAEVFPIATDEEGFIKSIERYFDCGFDHVYVQLNTHDDEKAIDLLGKKVLPHFAKSDTQT
jgi:coenzyme F420-dependent glucose-6-phosphate dehydrogenase